MADLARIKRNVAKMASQGAPEADIDGYISSEGVTVDDVRAFRETGAAGQTRPGILDEMTRRAGQLAGIPYDQPFPSAKDIGQASPSLGFARDVLTVAPTHFLNQFLYNTPRSAAAQAGYELPIEASTRVGDVIAHSAGIAGAVASPVNKFIAAQFFKPQFGLATKALGAAGGGFAYSPNEGLGRLEQRRQQAAFGALVPTTIAGLRKTGQFVNRAGRWVAREFGGVTDATVDTIKRLGADRVFDPAKARVDYLGGVVAPKAQQRIVQAVTEQTPDGERVLKSLGIKPEAIATLRTIDPATRQHLAQAFSGGVDDVGETLASLKQAAGKQYARAIPSDASIDVGGPLLSLKRTLINQGWVDVNGNELAGAGIPNRTKTVLVKILKHYAKAGPEGQALARVAAPLSGRQYQNLLSELEAGVSGNPKFDRLVFAAEERLRQVAARQVPALRPATKAYADALRLEELGKVFIKLDNVVNLEQKLLGLKNVAKPQLHGQWQTILGKDLYDDVLAHLANQDFELVSGLPGSGGALYPSRAGIIRQLISKGAKRYHQRVAPVQEAVSGAAKRGLGSIRKVAGY